jgi:hypothetical protein
MTETLCSKAISARNKCYFDTRHYNGYSDPCLPEQLVVEKECGKDTKGGKRFMKRRKTRKSRKSRKGKSRKMRSYFSR